MDRIIGTGWVDIGGGKRGFRDEDLTHGIEGTDLVAAWFNSIQEELMAIILAAGLTPNSAVWTQVLTALDVLFAGKVSPQFSGVPAVVNATGGAGLLLDSSAGTDRSVLARTAGITRWEFGAESTAETGGNAGSDFIVGRYSDSGSWIDVPLRINRATGGITLLQPPVVPAAAAAGNPVNLGQFGASFGASGYQKLPGGFILQWATGATISSPSDAQQQTITFATAFPNGICGAPFVTKVNPTGSGLDDYWFEAVSWTNSAVVVCEQNTGGGSAYVAGSAYPTVFVIGH